MFESSSSLGLPTLPSATLDLAGVQNLLAHRLRLLAQSKPDRARICKKLLTRLQAAEADFQEKLVAFSQAYDSSVELAREIHGTVGQLLGPEDYGDWFRRDWWRLKQVLAQLDDREQMPHGTHGEPPSVASVPWPRGGSSSAAKPPVVP